MERISKPPVDYSGFHQRAVIETSGQPYRKWVTGRRDGHRVINLEPKMRVNIYAEEMTERVEIISKEIDGQSFTGLRLYLELPVTVNGEQKSGPFLHHPGDDDSAAVTF